MITAYLFVSTLVFLVNAQIAAGVTLVDDVINGVEGEDYTFICQNPQSDSVGVPPDLRWQFPLGTEIFDGAMYGIVSTKNESSGVTVSSLTIKNAKSSSNGEYFCVYETSSAGGLLKVVPTATVTVVDVSGEFSMAVGTTFGCSVNGLLNKSVTWTLDGEELVQGRHDLNNDGVDSVEVTQDMEVRFLTAGPEVTGTYTCTYQLATDLLETSSVTIAGEIVILLDPSIKVTQGESGDMVCRARSDPRPTITWYRQNGTEVTDVAGKITLVAKDGKEPNEAVSTLTIDHVQPQDLLQPYFNCSATNGADTVQQAILLRLRGKYEALWPFIGIISEVAILIVIILLHELCTSGDDIGEVEEDEEDHLLQKSRSITREGERETRMRGTNN